MPQENAKNVWDEGRWADVEEIEFDFMTNYIMEHVLSAISPTGKTTVELGSGTGRLSYLMLKNGARKVTMVDSSKKAIELATSLFQKEDPNSYEVVESDIFQFKQDQQYDIVFSSGVIEHFTGVKRFEIIKKHTDLASHCSIILHPSNTLYQRFFSVFPPAVKLYGFARPYPISEMNDYLKRIREVQDYSHKQFYLFYSVPLVHNQEWLNRNADSIGIGKRLGGFVLTHVAVDRREHHR